MKKILMGLFAIALVLFVVGAAHSGGLGINLMGPKTAINQPTPTPADTNSMMCPGQLTPEAQKQVCAAINDLCAKVKNSETNPDKLMRLECRENVYRCQKAVEGM
jgi:hypothetical protein